MSGPQKTLTGNQGLRIEEPLIFEYGRSERSGIDIAAPTPYRHRLKGVRRQKSVGLPGLSEPQAVRHYTRLSRMNYGIDSGFFPLGSCTMKHNPRLNEQLARLPGLADLHPFQPVSTVQGALELMDALARWLKLLTGMPAVALSPAAGAQGELCGMMAIRAALAARGDPRTTVLVPESAHGTNPATAVACRYQVETIPTQRSGRISVEAVASLLGPHVAAVMITNPNTCGLFETDMPAIARAVHDAGGLVYMDGANFNALVGRVRVADLGIDAMHINLHKTFSTPHGGGGPGSGPTVLSDRLAAYAPVPFVVHGGSGLEMVETAEHAPEGLIPFGRIKGFHGQFGTFIRALAYMTALGGDGLRQVSGDATLNANYLWARLKGELSMPYEGPVMHEVLFDDRCLQGTGITTLDLAKALVDEGFHPMTIYFPLVVSGAMLIEPTETESKVTLDQFVDAMIGLIRRAQSGDTASFKKAPIHAPRRRLDETKAARKPVLRWIEPQEEQPGE